MEWSAVIAPILLFILKIADYFFEEGKHEKTIVEKQTDFDRVLARGEVGLINRHIDDLNLFLRKASFNRSR